MNAKENKLLKPIIDDLDITCQKIDFSNDHLSQETKEILEKIGIEVMRFEVGKWEYNKIVSDLKRLSETLHELGFSEPREIIAKAKSSAP